MNTQNQYTLKDILKLEVAPALGCTEPAAVALATAAASSLLDAGRITSIQLWLSANIYKNAFAVAIPGTDGATGIDLAAALGHTGGDATQRLQVLAPVTGDHITAARELIASGSVEVNLLKEAPTIYIKAAVSTAEHTATATIEHTHDNITELTLDDKPLAEHPLLASISDSKSSLAELEDFLRTQTFEQLITLVETMDEEDFEFIRQGVEYNLKLARHGLSFGPGLGIGKTLDRLVREGLIKKDMIQAARILTSAACDARMSGAKLPAMSSAGSGNHGLTAILPIWAVKNYINETSDHEALKAVALSHLVTGYIKSHTGRLSAVCGCSIAAGAGASAAITYLMGGNLNHIASAIKNLICDLAGCICDGAKASCAFKLATAAGSAVQSALFSLHGINVKESDGIIALSPEQTIKNTGELSTQGMIETDRTILKIMIEKTLTD
ncbi:Serine dehydratase alpha chain [Anaerohalosphaera lusitana]|uniref:UPF0597 protein STSP2_00352 n=1 Tax=Anaerohalosphaera lusitana TaxID=1936003 RepID=A0A1U9NH09_9BACT|nr:L-serine ammonia-lyase, iron-sulfur-dependent, subunit alpha [Anaerohalosphaera lusitana]AQT67209.1 Serine dehydratase alpha chain [Anaerohalosphaera lusitana]